MIIQMRMKLFALSLRKTPKAEEAPRGDQTEYLKIALTF